MANYGNTVLMQLLNQQNVYAQNQAAIERDSEQRAFDTVDRVHQGDVAHAQAAGEVRGLGGDVPDEGNNELKDVARLTAQKVSLENALKEKAAKQHYDAQLQQAQTMAGSRLGVANIGAGVKREDIQGRHTENIEDNTTALAIARLHAYAITSGRMDPHLKALIDLARLENTAGENIRKRTTGKTFEQGPFGPEAAVPVSNASPEDLVEAKKHDDAAKKLTDQISGMLSSGSIPASVSRSSRKPVYTPPPFVPAGDVPMALDPNGGAPAQQSAPPAAPAKAADDDEIARRAIFGG